jgi:PAS domain S-box-containing protein
MNDAASSKIGASPFVRKPPPLDTSGIADESLRLLVDTGLALAGEHDMEAIVRIALEAGRKLSHAHFGAFFYTAGEHEGEPRQRYHFTSDTGGTHRADPLLPYPFKDDKFGNTVLRTGDVNSHPNFGGKSPFHSTPFADRPITSYMHVPICTSPKEQIGGMLYGHAESDRFSDAHEAQLVTLAAQACAAIETARLSQALTQEVALAEDARRSQRHTDERLRLALDAAELGTWTWNRTTDLLDLDERAAFLLDAGAPHHPLHRSDLRRRIVHEDDFNLTVDDMRDALATGGVYHSEYRIRTADGPERWICSRGIITFEGRDQITGMTGTVQDITSRKTQEAALRQSEKLAATGRLAATIAHEINNPLEAVTNLIYLSKTDPTVPTAVQHLLETADSELARVARIAQQTLGFYRDTTRPLRINLTELLEGVVHLFGRKMEQKKIECTLDLEPDLLIFGLQGEVRQIFSNLLVNAIDASPRSSITLRARPAVRNGRPGVAVLIADRGTGIPVSARQHMFTPFFTKHLVGTGLGLWVTRGIIEKQGGSIRFRTSTAGVTGTVFRVFLPAEYIDPEKFSTASITVIQ